MKSKKIQKKNFINSLVKLVKKESTHELNSKFDIKFFSKSYHNLILKENRSFFCMTYNLSHFISFIERHVFIVKACLLFIKKFVTN
jgi:hypothetical protein